MNDLRKTVRLLLVFVLLLGLLSGCGGSGGKPAVEESNEPVLKETVEEASEESAPEETVAAPTPAVFFGVEANPVIAQWDEFVFEKDPAPAAAAYANLLQNAFGFTVTEQSADDRGSRWSLQYGDRENAGIDISSTFTQAEKYVVTVIYSQSICWQDGAVYEWPAAEPAFVPDPEVYFHTAAAEKDDNSMTLVLSGTPGVVVYEYLSVLKNIYGLTEVDSYTETETWQWCMQKGGDENATVSIGLDKRGDGDWDLSFIFGENVTLVQAETWSGLSEKPEPEPEPAMSDPAVLPNFLANDSSGKYALSDSSTATKAVYKANTLDAEYVAAAYVELLKEHGYTVVYDEEKIYTSSAAAGKDLQWDLSHSDVDAGAVGSDSGGQICVKFHSYEKRNTCTVSIEFSDGITMEGFGGGGVGNADDDGSSGGSSSSRDTFTPEFAKQDCLTCRGDGDCNTCGGYGEVRKYAGAGETVRAKCSTCRGSGKCKACGGSGKR